MPSLGSGLSLGTLNKISGYDFDASAYFDSTGITDAVTRAKINNFVVGVKNLGLWSSFICWPLKSSQNRGSGTIAYSLGGFGPYNGSFVSSPTWGVDGVTFNGSNSIGISTAVGSSRVNKFSIGIGKITGYNINRFFDIQDGGSTTRRNPLLGVGSFGSFDVALNLPNSGVSAPEVSSFTSNLPRNTYYSVIGRVSGSSLFVYRDKVQKATLTGQTFAQGSPYTSSGIGVGYEGTIAFVALAGEDTTESQAFALNDLYYSTLGNNLDADADSYILRAGVTDATAQTQINDFVVGVKALGVWNNMVCWPSRSAQNAGTGNTIYSLGGLGTFNATKTAGITWNANGLRATTANQYANFSNPFNATTLNGVSTWSVTSLESINSTNWFNGFINIRSSDATNNLNGFYNLLYADSANNNAGGGSTNSFPTPGFFRRDYGRGSGAVIGAGFHSQLTSTQANPNLCVMLYDTSFQGNLIGSSGGTTFVNAGSNNFFMSSSDASSNFTTSMYGAFYATFNSYVASNSTALYTLYKNTLGTGLGLP